MTTSAAEESAPGPANFAANFAATAPSAAQVGAPRTANQKRHIEQAERRCSRGIPESALEHRHLECPDTAHHRAHIGGEMAALRMAAPWH